MRMLLSVLGVCGVLVAGAQEGRPGMVVKVSSDFLALHVSGTAPSGTTKVEFRVAESGRVAADAPWGTFEGEIGADGAFAWEVPLRASRWGEVQVRAMKDGEVLARHESRHEPRRFTMVTAEQIAAMANDEHERWAAFMERSNELFEKEYDTLAGECRGLKLAHAEPAPARRAEFEFNREPNQSWFASEEAKRLVSAVISFQTPSGGWSKAVNYAAVRNPGMHWTSQTGMEGWHYCGTLDNRSTTEQMRFLANVHAAGGDGNAREAALRGIEWLFAAQYPNGGWPQNYPVEPGYHEAITLNDNAMVHAMGLMVTISEGEAPFAFVDESLRRRARGAFEKALVCLGRAQVRVNGERTVWCAQHDPVTLAPVAARKKEPPSLSGAESAELLKFLMRKGPTSQEMVAMIEPALRWFESHRVTGLRKTKNAAGKTDFVADAGSDEVYWARFYEVETGRPIFAGAQDGIIYSSFGEMAANNEVGYEYYTTKPRDLLEKEVVRWRKRMGQAK